MAAGFLGGFVKGAVLGALVLAALSLVAPQPVPRGEGAEDAVPAPETTAPEAPAAAAGPAEITLPVGSEFARSEDGPPASPAPLTAPAPESGPGGAPMPTPAVESPPAGTATPSSRPEPSLEAPSAPAALVSDPDPIDLPAAPRRSAPVPVAPPGEVLTPGLDRAPQRADTAPLAPENDAAEQPPNTPAVSQSPPASPDLPLVLPPTISELLPSTN